MIQINNWYLQCDLLQRQNPVGKVGLDLPVRGDQNGRVGQDAAGCRAERRAAVASSNPSVGSSSSSTCGRAQQRPRQAPDAAPRRPKALRRVGRSARQARLWPAITASSCTAASTCHSRASSAGPARRSASATVPAISALRCGNSVRWARRSASAQSRNADVAKQDLTRGNRVQPGDGQQQRRFARATGPGDRNGFTSAERARKDP